MAQVTLPYTLTAGTPENVNNLVSNLNALVTGVNTIDTAQIATGAVTTTQIADGTIATGDLASSVGNFGAWTAYTATVTAETTNPTLGTGSTNAGYYAQVGKVVTARFKIQFGTSGVAAGLGAYFVALPVAAATAQASITVGNGYGYDSSAIALSAFTAYCNTANRIAFLFNTTLNGAYAVLGAAAPWTWAANDYFEAAIQYEAA